MIAVVLSDAIARIKDHQQYFREDYDRIGAELKIVLALMEAQRIMLETGPYSRWGRSQLHRLGRAIRAVDITEVIKAVDDANASRPAA